MRETLAHYIFMFLRVIPTLDLASAYVDEGGFYGGIFCWNATLSDLFDVVKKKYMLSLFFFSSFLMEFLSCHSYNGLSFLPSILQSFLLYSAVIICSFPSALILNIFWCWGQKSPTMMPTDSLYSIKAPKFYMKLEAKSSKITYVLLYLLTDLWCQGQKV